MSAVSVEIDGGVGRISLTSPQDGNAIDTAFCDSLLDAAEQLGDDDAVRVVLISSQGRNFCVGANVKMFAGVAWQDFGDLVRTMTDTLHPAVERLASMPKPVVTLVQGNAAGAGMGLGLLGDICIVTPETRFTAAYPAIGLSPDGGLSYVLPRLVGMRRAQEILILEQSVGGDEAVRIGLATRMVNADELSEAGLALAAGLAQRPTRALGRAKELLLRTYRAEIRDQLDLEAALIAQCAGEPHASEGVTAFAERRKAVFA